MAARITWGSGNRSRLFIPLVTNFHLTLTSIPLRALVMFALLTLLPLLAGTLVNAQGTTCAQFLFGFAITLTSP